MAASSQDKLMEVGIATATTLDANYTINDTSITVASTSGWPTATGVAFAIDVVDSAGVQVPGTYNEYVGVVSSATSITSVDHMNGTDRNYSAGATTRVYMPVSAERENRIVEWGVVQHKQDGTHANTITTNTINENTPANGVTIDGLNIKDSAITTANSIPNSAIQASAVTPEKILTGTGTSWAWQSWTPTWTNVSGGTLNYAKYVQIGKTVHFRLRYTLAGAGVSGGIIFTTPTSINSDLSVPLTDVVEGNVTFVDSGSNFVVGSVHWASSTTVHAFCWNAAVTYARLETCSSTIPFTWGSGDTITVVGTYEAA